MAGDGWMFMQDGVLFATFNHQGGPRGETEFIAQNWWMGMASRGFGAGELTLAGMFSLDPLTVGRTGYSEIFQAGEALDGQPLVDRQHPHDLAMQLAAMWRVPVGSEMSLTIAGAPVGEATLGPTAFMHRASAAENPTAPLGHHTLDSSHIAMGVIAAALDGGRWTAEASVFHGREPDDNRWDIMDPGALDSWAVRGWLRPNDEWELQLSTGHLTEPEELEPGDLQRTTVSASWLRQRTHGLTSATVTYGRNDKNEGAEDAFLAEATHWLGRTGVYGRFEIVERETDTLGGTAVQTEDRLATVSAFTVGAIREMARVHDFEIGLGGDLTLYGVPEAFEPTHGSHPVSLHLFLRVRPPVSGMGRMWNMRMLRPH